MKNLIVLPIILITLTACSHVAQTTSGGDYVLQYTSDTAGSGNRTKVGAAALSNLDQSILDAASVEPILTFPARIGLAKISSGELSVLDASELARWKALTDKYQAIGEFMYVNPLNASYVSSSVGKSTSRTQWKNTGQLVEIIRLGAARQHLDAVLIYDVDVSSQKRRTAIAFADFTIIGSGVLPTRSLQIETKTQVLLLDVRNGYPYGSASSSTQETKLATSWGTREKAASLRKAAALKATQDIIPEVDAMLEELLKQTGQTN